MNSGRRRIERTPSGSAVSSVVSKFSQKSQESYSRDRPPPRLREPLSSRENVTNKLKGPKSPVPQEESINKSKRTGSQSSVKSIEIKERRSSTQSDSRRSSAASTETDNSVTVVTVNTNGGLSPSATNEELSRLTANINGDLSPLGKITTPQFVNPEQSGYVGFANLPNQVHRKSVKKGFEFTLMVVGESGLGKSTLVNSLFLTDLYPERHIPTALEKVQQTVKIDASSVEIEERGVKLRLTVVDTPGFGDSLNSVECFKPIIQYVDDQFERYLNDESGLNRRHIVDNRVHCCFYFINPSGHGMRPLDIAFMKAVHHKVNIVPVIAKADTLTKKEVLNLKRRIMNQIEQYGISLYPLPDCDEDEDEDYREQCRLLKEAVPFAVVGSNTIIEVKGKKVRGRMYPWGVVEVENPDHCDFIKLRTMLITHMQDLQEVTQEVHYENFRAERLANGTAPPKKTNSRQQQQQQPKEEPAPVRSYYRTATAEPVDQREIALQEKERELRKMQEMLARMQAEMAAQKGDPQQNGGVKSHNV